jgi:hypothetical protein
MGEIAMTAPRRRWSFSVRTTSLARSELAHRIRVHRGVRYGRGTRMCRIGYNAGIRVPWHIVRFLAGTFLGRTPPRHISTILAPAQKE